MSEGQLRLQLREGRSDDVESVESDAVGIEGVYFSVVVAGEGIGESEMVFWGFSAEGIVVAVGVVRMIEYALKILLIGGVSDGGLVDYAAIVAEYFEIVGAIDDEHVASDVFHVGLVDDCSWAELVGGFVLDDFEATGIGADGGDCAVDVWSCNLIASVPEPIVAQIVLFLS